MIEMGKEYLTQSNGQTIRVRTIEIEQRLGRFRGKWVCLNLTTQRRIHRTERQLRYAPPSP